MWLVNTPSKHETLTQCWPTVCDVGLASNQPRVCWAVFNSSWSGSAHCWRQLQADTNPMSVKCWARVAGADQYSALVSIICWRERVHIQGGVLLQTVKWKYILISQVCTYRLLEGLWQAKESAVTPAKRKYIYTEMNGTHRLTERHRKRTEVNQHVPTSLYRGETQ